MANDQDFDQPFETKEILTVFGTSIVLKLNNESQIK